MTKSKTALGLSCRSAPSMEAQRSLLKRVPSGQGHSWWPCVWRAWLVSSQSMLHFSPEFKLWATNYLWEGATNFFFFQVLGVSLIWGKTNWGFGDICCGVLESVLWLFIELGFRGRDELIIGQKAWDLSSARFLSSNEEQQPEAGIVQTNHFRLKWIVLGVM